MSYNIFLGAIEGASFFIINDANIHKLEIIGEKYKF
jgi:hypothetical protein